MRPALYEAWHDVVPDERRPGARPETWDIVGPICESGDWLARGRTLPLEQDDLLAIQSAGAYGFSMSSQYNSRPRAAEVLVDGQDSYLVRPRETPQELFASERIPQRP
jgi:diaminopimelate decarboxylase